MKTQMKQKTPFVYLIIMAAFALSSCEKVPLGHDSDYLAIPVGRSFLQSSSVDVRIGGETYESDFSFDSCGGYWIYIHKSMLSNGDEVKVCFTRRNEDLVLFPEIVGEKQEWVSPSHYIDSDHETIVAKATELCEGLTSRLDKAKMLHNYVYNHVALKIFFDASLDNASTTEALGYGTCMNSSRLFIALCRAVNVPARSVWGIVNAHEDIGGYNNHHQWAESLDDSGNWHAADFGYTIDFDLNDIRYLDLIYAAEENSILRNRKDYHIIFEDLIFNYDYPTVADGKIRFRINSDNRPDSMQVEYTYEFYQE